MPARLIKPSVVLIPTNEFAFEGQTTEPSVSVPIPIVARFAAIAAPVPELEPQGFRSSTYGFFVWPPRPLQPLVEWLERKLAHSLRFVLPMITAPASRRRLVTNESCGGIDPPSASEPAVVVMRSWVSMLSLMITGIPCRRPRVRPALRSLPISDAMCNASGFNSMTELIVGPSLSIERMRFRYFAVSESAVYFPLLIPRY